MDIKGYALYPRKTLSIAWPVIFESLMVSFIQFAGTIMVGKLGAEATAAVAVNTSPSWFINALPMVYSVGGTVFVARYIGAGKKKKSSYVATHVMFFALLSSLIITLIMVSLSGFIPGWMGATGNVLPMAKDYLRIYCIGMPFSFMAVVAAGMLRGAGNTKSPMLIALLANIINVVCSFILIYETRVETIPLINASATIPGMGMGVSGAATATAISQGFMGVFTIWLLFRKNSVLKMMINTLKRPDLGVLKQVLSVGVPVSLERISVSLGQIVYQRMIAELGTIEMSAHFLATTAESLSYMPANGFSIAATTLVGQSIGARNKNDALSYARVNLAFSFLVGIISCVLFLSLSNQLLSIFSSDPDVIREGAAVIRIIAVVEPIFNMTITAVGVFRGAGDTRIPFIAALVGMWGIRLISTWLFIFVFHMGLSGAWISMAIDNSIRLVFLMVRYKRRRWLENAFM